MYPVPTPTASGVRAHRSAPHWHEAVGESAAARFASLINQRVEYGQHLYGAVDPDAPSYLPTVQMELCDASSFLDLEVRRWQSAGLVAPPHWTSICQRGQGELRVLGDAVTRCGGPSYRSVAAQRSAYGQMVHGEAYRHRANLPEALEELADAVVYLGLERERLAHHTDADAHPCPALNDIEDGVMRVGWRVATLQAVVDQLPAARP